MPDLKITQLTADTTPQGADLLTSVKSPFGAGSNRKVLVSDFFGLISTPVGIGVTANTFSSLDVLEVRGNVDYESDYFYVDPIPVPGASTAALISPAAAGNVSNGTHTYVVTYVTGSGSETLAGSTSNSVTVTNNAVNGKISLTNVAISLNPSVFSRNIYRDKNSDGIYKLVGSIANNTVTTFTDNIADGSLGGNPPTIEGTGNIHSTNISSTTISANYLQITNTSDFFGKVTFNGGFKYHRTHSATNYTLLNSDSYLGITSTAAPRTVTMPTAVGIEGQIFIIKDESGGALANNITVATTGGQLIDGAATQTINTNYGAMWLISSGANWFII